MRRRFFGSKMLGASPRDRLFIEADGIDAVKVIYQPSLVKLKASERYATAKQHGKAMRKLIELDGKEDRFTIYPLNTFPTDHSFLQPKYERIESITLKGFKYETLKAVEDVIGILSDLPPGFVKNYDYGLGLLKDYRFIVNAIETIPKIKHLVISMDHDTAVSGDSYTLSFADYESIRKGINRITSRQQEDGARDKWILAHNSLLTAHDPTNFPEQTQPYRKDTILKTISGDGKERIPLSTADQNAAILLVDQNRKELAERAPQQLLQLRNDIELTTLEVLIAKFEGMLAKGLLETRWQALFNDNPFILNLAFGYPIIKIQDQAHLGGQKLSGSGETISDFLVKNGISNNAAIFEIKTPRTPLLNKRAYRGQIYTPSSDLVGAINQMLDQKSEFQKDVARIKENSHIYNLESYAVHGVLLIGTTPIGSDEQKSFELFRGNSKDVTIITFDELLAKLKLLHDFLLSKAPEARQAATLRALETRVLQLLNSFNGLYKHSGSKVRGFRTMTATPPAGVDGNCVMNSIGKLGILKSGFERARLQKPPYAVGIDESADRAVTVRTLHEFIARAEEVIADLAAVLATQIENKAKPRTKA